MQNSVHQLLQEEDGASAVEYAILAALIAAVIVGVVFLLGKSVVGLFEGFRLP